MEGYFLYNIQWYLCVISSIDCVFSYDSSQHLSLRLASTLSGGEKSAPSQELADASVTVVRAFKTLGVALQPKAHFMLHMAVRSPPIDLRRPCCQEERKTKNKSMRGFVCRSASCGAPKLSGCWRDEGLNRNLRDAAASAHRRVWTRRVISSFRSSVSTKRAKLL